MKMAKKSVIACLAAEVSCGRHWRLQSKAIMMYNMHRKRNME